jgi:uncharacterized protein YggE
MKGGRMRRIPWLVVCLAGILLFFAAGCTSQVTCVPQQQQTGIWVTGQGEVMASPDTALVALGIEARAATVAEAQTEASEAMNKVMKALQDGGVAEKDIQTQQYSIYPITKWDEEEKEEEIIGYRVVNMVLAKIRELDKAGSIIDAVAQAGGDYARIQNVSFTIEDPAPYYEQARAKALRDASNKARQIAELTGVRLGRPTYVSEGTAYLQTITRTFDELQAVPTPATPISPGELKITANIQVVYAIE